jgi:hypothetical protein
LDRRKVGDAVWHIQLGANLTCTLEFTSVALPVVNGKSVWLVSFREKMTEEHSRIEPSGVYGDSFHEFSGFARLAEPWEFESRARSP